MLTAFLAARAGSTTKAIDTKVGSKFPDLTVRNSNDLMRYNLHTWLHYRQQSNPRLCMSNVVLVVQKNCTIPNKLIDRYAQLYHHFYQNDYQVIFLLSNRKPADLNELQQGRPRMVDFLSMTQDGVEEFERLGYPSRSTFLLNKDYVITNSFIPIETSTEIIVEPEKEAELVLRLIEANNSHRFKM